MKTKSKRDKSQVIKQKQVNPQLSITHQKLQELCLKQFELEVLTDKVNRSKPILETIYEKFKRKEQKLNKSFQKVSRKLRASSDLLIKYRQLYQDGLKIMSRNKLVQLFKDETNYRFPINSLENNAENLPTSQNKQFLQKIKQKYGTYSRNHQRDKTISKIKQKYGQKEKDCPQLNVSKEEIYANYKKKLGEKGHFFDKPDSLTTKQLSLNLLQQADLDLQRVASRSIQSRQKRQIKQAEQIEKTDVKQRYLLMQRQKLMRL